MSRRSKLFFLLFIILFVPACIFNTGYQKRNDSYVYATSNEGQGYVEHAIPAIDVESFQVLNKQGYAKDNRQVYFEFYPIEGADPASFTALSDRYGKDNAHVFYMLTPIPGADPDTFDLFDKYWGRDSHDIYFQEDPIQACDPATFVLLEEQWQKDSQCVYRNGIKAPDADPASFVIINFWFGKDKNHVYSNDPTIIEGADPATFKVHEVCELCGTDKNGCYKYDEQVDCEEIN